MTTNWPTQDDLAAGREMDALVARDVMGWQRDAPDSIWWRVGERLIEAPLFSADISAAWQMVEHMRRRRRFVQITCPVGGGIAVDIEGPNGETLESSWAESAPLAICRAAFKAVSSRIKPNTHWDSYEPRAETPAVGSTWIWERDKPHAREHVSVLEVRWNGKEWWVQTHSQSGDYWNDLSRFWEACWPDPDPNTVQVGQELIWHGRPAFQRSLPCGWQPQNLGSPRSWSRVGETRWRRVLAE